MRREGRGGAREGGRKEIRKVEKEASQKEIVEYGPTSEYYLAGSRS